MANYRWSICDPTSPTVIEKGRIEQDRILETFEQFPWIEQLRNMSSMKEEDICFSPSLEFENTDTKLGVLVSIVGDINNYEFYIFYKRPKTVKSFFGLIKRNIEGCLSEITDQTMDSARKFLAAFINGDTAYMESQMR